MTTIISTTLLFCFTFFSLLSPFKANVVGFSTDLIHRYSPASPFYDPLLTPFDHALNTLRRSRNRMKYFASTKNENSTSSVILPTHAYGEYLMKITLGTPPFTVFVCPDTGSDLTWTQCAPCKYCWKQKAPLFYPRKSSTYKTYSYNSSKCQYIDERYRDSNGACEYSFKYGSGSSRGTLASETLKILGSNRSRPLSYSGIRMGCAYNNSGLWGEDESGIVGLGGGPLSLVSQIKPSIDAKFSYCLPPAFSKIKTNGQINFGSNAVVSGKNTMTTPIIPKPLEKPLYFLNLEAISVGKHRIEFFNSSSAAIADAGNIYIDSGTALTFLPMEIYFKFRRLVKKYMGRKTAPAPFTDLDLCYELNDKLSYPRIKAHFTGATVDLKPINTFIQIRENITCLAFHSTLFQNPVYGSVAQTNFLIGFDTAKGTVTFKPTKCGHGSS